MVGGPIAGVEGYGDKAASAIGSKANEKVDVEDVGVYGAGGLEVVGEITSIESWPPSSTDCFLA